jgi:phage-related protein
MAGKKTIWDLSLEIAGKDKGASAALKQVRNQIRDVQAAAAQVGGDFKKFTGDITKLALGVGGGVAAATAGVVAMANSFAATGDKVAKTSAAIGIGIEAYQGLSYAMEQSGLSAEEFDGALQKFNLTVKQGAAGNAAAQKQLAEIGLSAQKLAGMKPEQAMMRLSDYMKQLPNDAERTRTAVTLFGKAAGPKMMAAMKQGSAGLQELMKEAKSLGIVLTDEQAHQSEAYVSAQSRLMKSVSGMKNQFISGAIGPLTEAFDHLKNAVVDQLPAIQELGAKFGQWLGELVKHLPEIIAKIKEFGSKVWDNVQKVKDFLGGWKNVVKIIAGIAIAPTLISGLKTVFSLGKFIQVGFKAIPKILANIGLSAVPLSGALLPIIGIIAGIALVIYTVVKNFDTLKQYALDCIERIKSAFGGATGGMTVNWQKVGEVAKTVLGTIMAILEGGVLFAIKTVMNFITSAIQVVIGAFKTLWNVVKLILWPIETIIKVIIAVFTGGWSGAIETLKGQFGKLGDIFSGIFDGIKTMIGGVLDFWKNYFNDALDFVKGIFGGLSDKFGGVFTEISNGITATVEGIKNIWNGIPGFFSGLLNNVKNIFLGVINWVKTNWKAIVAFFINPFAGVFKYFYDNFEGFRNLVNNVIGAVVNSFKGLWENVKSIFGSIGEFFSGIWEGIKGITVSIWEGIISYFSNVIEGFKIIWNGIIGFFAGLWEAIKQGPTATIEYIKNAFFGLFDGIKNKFLGFINVIKDGWDKVKGFFGGIGDSIGGLFGKDRSIDIATHAEGGIFTHRHVAEIAEKGAEAVVPLNNTPQGYDIWKQAGLLGGYLKDMGGQAPAVLATASAVADTPSSKIPEPSPVMEAAAQKVSAGDTAINMEFKLAFNFSGGTPDEKTIKQVSEAGQKAAIDIETKIRSVIESMTRENRRLSFA